MDNIEIKVEGNRVIVSFDVTPEGELSSTGKTKLIASTRVAWRWIIRLGEG
jgi:hypothetical protein